MVNSPKATSVTTATILAAWLFAALINEFQLILKSYRWDVWRSHFGDPLNNMRLVSLILPFPALSNSIFRYQIFSEGLSVACVSFAIVLMVVILGVRLLLLDTLHKKLGPLVLVSYRMFNDVFNWSILVAVVILAFAVALNHLISAEIEGEFNVDEECYDLLQPYSEGVGQAALQLMHVLLDTGTTNMYCFESMEHWLGGSTLMYSYQLIVVILYLNMLIGMMGATLEHVADEAESRLYIFTSLVIRYRQAGVPTPLSIVHSASSWLFGRLCPKVCQKSEDVAALTPMTEEIRKLERKRAECLDLPNLKKKVDENVEEMLNKSKKVKEQGAGD
jgi:hypothetical protein